MSLNRLPVIADLSWNILSAIDAVVVPTRADEHTPFEIRLRIPDNLNFSRSGTRISRILYNLIANAAAVISERGNASIKTPSRSGMKACLSMLETTAQACSRPYGHGI